jgi:hypothetical protein
MTTPPISVPKPPMAFVREWTTKSTPRPIGLWQNGVVHHREHAFGGRPLCVDFARDIGNGLQIDQPQRGVHRGFHIQHTRGPGDPPPHLRGVGEVRECHADLEPRVPVGQQRIGAPVQHRVRDDLASAPGQDPENAGDGTHATGERNSYVAPFGIRQIFF